jgi:hypothetical protein
VHQWKIFILRDHVAIAVLPGAIYITADARTTQVLQHLKDFLRLFVNSDSLVSLANISHCGSFDPITLLVPLEDSSKELDHSARFRRSDVVLDHRGKSKLARRMYIVLPAALLEGS